MVGLRYYYYIAFAIRHCVEHELQRWLLIKHPPSYDYSSYSLHTAIRRGSSREERGWGFLVKKKLQRHEP